jgi:hypothetical protein
MSEERRRKQVRGSSASEPKSHKRIVWGVVVAILFVGAFAAGSYRKNHRYDAFAKCLASKQAKMYGLYWCPHCLDQKEMFGKAFQYVPYQECAIKGSREMAPGCKVAGAKQFPSWQFEGGPLREGVLSMEDLSGRTGCSLP